MEKDVSRLLSKIAIAHRNASEEALTAVGLHSGQANVLFSLWKEDGRAQAELMRDLGVTAPTVNVLVSKLEEQGYVVSRPCPEDGRLRRIHLTEKGREKRGEAEEAIRALGCSTLKGLSEIEKNTALLILDKIHENLTGSDRRRQTPENESSDPAGVR